MTIGARGQTVFTGNLRNPLADALKDSIEHCDRLRIISSFIQVSGVDELEPALRSAVKRGIEIELLTGTYLDITDPKAIELLKITCGDNIRIRFYKGNNSFHPKAYFVYSRTFGDSMFVGSSNISRSAFSDGVEWNYRIIRKTHWSEFQEFEEMFDTLWNKHSYDVTDEVLKKYKENRKPSIKPPLPTKGGPFEPNDVQVLALKLLEKTRDEGMDRGLVVAATGTGKTYLAALDSKGFEKVLFVAHSRYILEQARNAFRNIRPESSCGFCFAGIQELDKDCVFATVQTLRKQSVLDQIPPDRFDYIVMVLQDLIRVGSSY